MGDSDGDFGDTNFSGNVEDLLSAIDYLTTNYMAPTLAIGHSLGGAAVIFASAKAKSIKAVATIGTPSDTKHVKHLFGDQIDAIVENGEAVVQLSGRPFKIKEQFLRDVDEQILTQTLKDLTKTNSYMSFPTRRHGWYIPCRKVISCRDPSQKFFKSGWRKSSSY